MYILDSSSSVTAGCPANNISCRTNATELCLTGLLVFWPVLYFVIYVYYINIALSALRQRPYNDFRMGNITVRLQVSVCDFYSTQNLT